MSNKKKINTNVKAKLTEYLEAWKSKDWLGMLKASTHTFKVYNRPNYFDEWFGKSELLSYEILKEEPNNLPAMQKVKVKVIFKRTETEEQIEATYDINLVQEIEPYQPSINGTWGINPPSSLKYLQTINVTIKKEQ